MERRLHTRHRARTTVYITMPGGRRKLCRAVNLSATGVFIETTNLGLRKGQHVDLAFAINLGAVTRLHRRTAVVAHVSRGGTGLMMQAYSSTARASVGSSSG
ncbi:MAG: PilZ domain-containing protein [Steroidobacteraceae bacterium]